MAQNANSKTLSGRELALARRRAMSTSGKAAIGGAADRTASSARATTATAAPAKPAPVVRATGNSTPASVGRSASLARRQAMSTRGKAGVQSGDRVRSAAMAAKSAPQPAAEKRDEDCGCGCGGNKKEQAVAPAPAVKASSGLKPRINAKQRVAQNPTRAAALARRQAQSTRGKAGVSAKGITAAQTARAANPNLSGRELAQALRSQRATSGSAGEKKSKPTGRVRPSRTSKAGGAEDQPWKVGVSETASGQSVTGTMVGRSESVTGDEPSTCRGITGTEYLGADIFRAFCGTEPSKNPAKVRKSPTSHGNTVTGNEVGRSSKVTGDEPGTCKNVTGTEYFSANQSQAFCGTETKPGPSKVTGVETAKGKSVTGSNVGRAKKVTGDEPGQGRTLTGTQYTKPSEIGNAPAKVGRSDTLRGGSVSGTLVGRSGKVTGDEPGSCRNITGDDYVGKEQYTGFCDSTPAPKDQKVGASKTFKGETVTGTQAGRASRVTGNEPGTCKAVTGTPYAGAEQFGSFCKPDDAVMAEARAKRKSAGAGSVMTGIQPGVGGKMTGDQKGACEPVSGTPYVGADQMAAACPATAAAPNSPDFPQALGQAAPWGDFSVAAPSHASNSADEHAAITGSRYEQGHITGPFGMAPGKVTGTEEARFGRGGNAPVPAPMPETAAAVEGRVKPRISGEGMDAGVKITGDDWDRGDRVTGTEGMTAAGRNPTRRGPMSAMANVPPKRNEEVVPPVSKVTGSSGNTEQGSLITYSGGARG